MCSSSTLPFAADPVTTTFSVWFTDYATPFCVSLSVPSSVKLLVSFFSCEIFASSHSLGLTALLISSACHYVPHPMYYRNILTHRIIICRNYIMKVELLVFGITAFFIANTYHEGRYVTILKSWKKYYHMIGIGFAGLSAYLFLKKYPNDTGSLLTSAAGVARYLPVDKESADMLTPLINMTKQSITSSSCSVDNNPQTQRMLNSGKTGTKRSVSETKKKYVAAQQGWKCGHCQRQLPGWFEVDHKVRLDCGGSNHVDNLIALCRDCHGKKTALENL
jgi:5-methylcytosine-specific restriction endonuclease McrA